MIYHIILQPYMNSGFDNLLVNGFLTCLYLQLFIVGLFNFLNGSKRNMVLGGICCVVCLSFIYSIYWDNFNGSLVYNIVFGGYKHMFLPVLVYLYIALIAEEFSNRKLAIIFSVPLFAHIAYLLVKFGLKDFYLTNINSVVLIFNLFILGLFIYYTIIGIAVLKKVKQLIRKKNYTRYSMFFYVIMGYRIFLSLNAVVPYFIGKTSFENSFLYHSENFFIILAAFINLGILVFAFVESPSLKQFILSKNIYKSKDAHANAEPIEIFIENVFVNEKQFKSPDFNLNMVLAKYNIKPTDFRAYIKEKYNMSIVNYINKYRIEAFKNMLTEVDLKMFNLMGIASQVGYSSKATFYRNFKAIEGVTPKEYIDKNIKTKS